MVVFVIVDLGLFVFKVVSYESVFLALRRGCFETCVGPNFQGMSSFYVDATNLQSNLSGCCQVLIGVATGPSLQEVLWEVPRSPALLGPSF